MSPPRYSQYHEGINGLPLSLFFTNKDLNTLSGKTKTRTPTFITLETPLQQKQTNLPKQKTQQNPLDTSPHSQSIKSHCCSSSTSKDNAGNYSKAVNIVFYCGIFPTACLATIQNHSTKLCISEKLNKCPGIDNTLSWKSKKNKESRTAFQREEVVFHKKMPSSTNRLLYDQEN